MSVSTFGMTYIDVAIGGVDRTFDLADMQALSIGRDPQATVVLSDDPMVSRKHALVQRVGAGWILSDMGSRNGTTHNGVPVAAPVSLTNGDTFTIGSHRFDFHDTAKRAAPDPALDRTAMLVIERRITIMVLDLCDYTGLSRRLGEARISQIMNRLFSESGEVLKRRGSWAQKYIGDTVMAFWVHPEGGDTPHDLVDMLESAVELRAIIDDLAEHFDLVGELTFGIGINTGVAVTGNMGSVAVSDHTAMGDTVNKAFRLEAVSRQIDEEIVVGQSTFDVMALPADAAALFQRHSVTLKGYEEPEEVHGLALDRLPDLIQALRKH